MTDPQDSGPGYAFSNVTDSVRDVDRKMRRAFSPFRAMGEGWLRVFDDDHQWRDPETGRFVKRDTPSSKESETEPVG